ncbi:MAG: methyltransferase [Gammaproteobacteria bacterium]|nr:methyltransferase [Gammaproteobacteria bacterium]
MPDIKTRKLSFAIGSFQGRLRALRDRIQYSDPDGAAERAGICSASWSLFGQLWPASKVLAGFVKTMDLKDRRILELGCGLGLPSLTLQYRGANITASDYHPLSQTFLQYNSRLNQLPDINFLQLDWNNPPDNETYELIIASDVLYDPSLPKSLSHAIEKLASPVCKVLLSCPGRGYKNTFSRKMEKLGFILTEIPVPFGPDEKPPHKGRLLSYIRG